MELALFILLGLLMMRTKLQRVYVRSDRRDKY
ncbi:hypothetical protein DOK67_0002782 [Enterococcus sp. DIV0212c]